MVALSDRISVLHLSPIRRVAALLAEVGERKELISFGGGGPSLPPAIEVIEEIGRRVKENPQASSAYTGNVVFLN